MEETVCPLGGWQTVWCQSNIRRQPLKEGSIKGVLIPHIYFPYRFRSGICQARRLTRQVIQSTEAGTQP